jgi:hypothetical protein
LSAAIVADEASNGDSAVGSAAYQMLNLSSQIWIADMDESATTSKQEDNEKSFQGMKKIMESLHMKIRIRTSTS